VFRAALAEGRFDTERAWLDAVRTSVQMAQLRAAVKAADDEAAAVRDGLADPALNDPALDEPAADLEALLASVEQAESAWTESERELATAHERLDSATRHSELLAAAVADGRQVLADTAAAIRLGNLVSGNGDNRLKMELTTYVLVRRFTEVIASANAQLRNICDSRYELEHTESRNGNARSGLGLQVHDHFTGISRDPKTLSGGEAFYVALSLALGLADVVRSESGGVDMGTLFIDEGFGSLDPDTLDDVMGVLDRLRAGGRVVGIVSHVQELKTRISDRIEVIPRADKSSVLRVIA
jgi:exonuclease SbcC